MSSTILSTSRTAEKSGDLLKAYDILMDGLAEDPDNRVFRYRAVLVLARAGATARALQEYERLGLNQIADDDQIISLGGRLLKDLSQSSADRHARQRYALQSQTRYGEAYALHGAPYPGINTATMACAAGDNATATTIAKEILETLVPTDESTAEGAYYAYATKAEALLLLDDIEKSSTALGKALAQDPKNYTAHATTLRQFDLICTVQNRSPDWLAPYRPPIALHYCGHMFDDVAPDSEVAALTTALTGAVTALNPGAGFGALAAGCDILMAEALLTHGAELHVVLPLLEEEFLDQSVRPFGPSWEQRYRACRDQATSLRFATLESNIKDESVFAFSSEFAMGLAIAHAGRLTTSAAQLVAWDGVETQGRAGTGADVVRGRSFGLPQTLIDFPVALRRKTSASKAHPETAATTIAMPRLLKAMLFADVRGFSKIKEQHIGPFVHSILTPLAAANEALPVPPDLVNTWGDGLHYVYPQVEDAAEAALALLNAFEAIDLEAAGLPSHLALRIGGHYGPVSPYADPFLHADSFFGTHITIAARIEPVAVPGTIYISEPFAALLALRANERFASDYVGQTELSKKFGRIPLFNVRRR
ncbi:MAG: TRAFs-binding domain-containing protein [Rhodospirillaceae bacterium]